jgi:hypothetical protein
VPSALDVQISIDGTDLFPTAGNTATATSGTSDIAIAIGNGSVADATGGTGDFALADGTNSDAGAGGTSPFGGDGVGSNDIAIDVGNNNGTLLGANAIGGDNVAIDIGNEIGDNLGANASPSAGSFDFAGVFGNNDTATAGSPRRF